MSSIPKERTLVLEALLDLPMGASMREVAARLKKHENTVRHHVHNLKKTGHVQVVKRGYAKRCVVVPVRLRLSETERDWLKMGVQTARVIVVVARAQGRRVSSSEVSKVLGWHHAVARYHLQRARVGGILEARHGQGYTLVCGDATQREFAGLHPRALMAVRHIAEQGRRVGGPELARVFDWSKRQVHWHMTRAVKAGLLTVRKSGGYAISSGASRINWRKSNLAPA